MIAIVAVFVADDNKMLWALSQYHTKKAKKRA